MESAWSRLLIGVPSKSLFNFVRLEPGSDALHPFSRCDRAGANAPAFGQETQVRLLIVGQRLSVSEFEPQLTGLLETFFGRRQFV
jgi:hypothetical protein